MKEEGGLRKIKGGPPASGVGAPVKSKLEAPGGGVQVMRVTPEPVYPSVRSTVSPGKLNDPVSLTINASKAGFIMVSLEVF